MKKRLTRQHPSFLNLILRSAILWSLAAIYFIIVGPVSAQDTPSPTAPAATETPAASPTISPLSSLSSATELPFLAPWVSPTPGEDGVIRVIVQPGEALWTIAARAGLSLQQLLQLNNLSENAIIQPGDTLLIGYGTPGAAASTTVAPLDTTPEAPLTLPPPTPRPAQVARPASAICLSAFEDLDRNGQHDTGEPLKAGVAFTIFNTTAVVANYVTDGVSEPYCLEGLAPGEYHVTRSLTPAERLTTNGDWALVLPAGSQLTQAFGSFTDPSLSARETPAAVALHATLAALPTPAALPGPATTSAAIAAPAVAGLADNSENTAAPGIPDNIGRLSPALGISLLIFIAVLTLLFRRWRPGNKRS